MTTGTSSPVLSKATPRDEDAKTIVSQAGVSHQVAGKETEYPDGGLRAWLVVAGGFAITFSTFGFINTWGVFQAYYQETMLPNVSPSKIAWIGSIQYALVFLPGLVTGRMFDLGYYRGPQLIAAAVFVAGTFLTAECREYWQFLLCQGFAVGLGCGFLFGPMIAVIAHWFKARRGVAIGIAASGSSVGGTIIPIVARQLIPMIGFKWAIRVISFILMAVVVVAIVTSRRRLPPVHVSGGLFNLKAFRYAPFTLYVWAALLAWLGLYSVLTYLQVYAKEVGISPNLIPYLISISNAASFVGRISSGYLSDRIGPLNALIPSTLITGIATFAWPFARSDGALIAIACIYGGSLGFFTGTWQMPPTTMGSVDDVGRRIGMLMSIITIGALAGPPSSGAIRDATGSFEYVGYYAGSIIILCVLSMVGVKYATLGRLTGKM
ncbi:MFS general substrate transporter [Rhizoctonia solani]|nr:MFS general substrate transporter [Rhizoctonia solani]